MTFVMEVFVIKRVNVITNHSMQLGIIVLSFAFYLTGTKKG